MMAEQLGATRCQPGKENAGEASTSAGAGIVEMALAVALRWPVFPCKANKKPITEHGFKEATRDPAAIRKAFRKPGAKLIGVPTGEGTFDAFDLDPRHGSDDWRRANIHRLPETRVHQTPGLPKVPADPVMPGEHWLFQHADGVRNIQGGKSIAPGLDVRGEGGYVIMPPSTGYMVISEAEIAPWPDWLLPLVVKAPKPKPSVRPVITPQHTSDQLEKRYRAFIDKLLANVRAAPEGAKHDTLLKNARALGGVMQVAGISENEAVDWLIEALPSTIADWDAARQTAIDGLRHGAAEPIELEDRPRPGYRGNGHKPPPPPPPGEDRRADVPPPDADPRLGMDDVGLVTEDSVALAFADKHHDDLRYCHHNGAWFRWTGHVWKREETKLAFSWARKLARDLARSSDNAKAMIGAGKAAFAAGAERMAQSDRAFAVTSEVWDTDKFLLGTPGGTVDLRTGQLREARQIDFITKQTSVTPAEIPDCPLWLNFLNEVTRGDQGLIRFIRQYAGYSLTGDTREECLVFFHGPGGNGKTKLLNVIGGILGDYCKTAAMDTFIASQGDRHPTDLAMLRGARMVRSSETEEGRNWAEVKINQLTGGDPISARFMRQDFFEFRPQLKLWIIGNHRPGLRNVTDAARRRINMVLFTFKPAKVDKNLEAKLMAEAPAILRWQIEGCLDWQKNGLIRPQVVLDATREYFAAQDTMHQWIDECCEVDLNYADTVKSLFASWANYAKHSGEEAGTKKRFNPTMEGLGYRPIKDTDGIRGHGFKGLKVRVLKWSGAEDDAR